MIKKLTNEIVAKRLENTDIILVGDIINSQMPANFKCKKCEFIWPARLGHILYSKSGCPQCSSNAILDNKQIDLRLLFLNKDIERIGDYSGIENKIKFKHKICGFIWEAKPNNILNNTRNCPQCAGNIPLNNMTINQRLIDFNITRIDNYINCNEPINFKCNMCCHIWKTKPSHILNGSGCPMCNSVGMNEKLIYNILTEHKVLFDYQYSLKNIDPKKRALRFDFYSSKYKIAIEYNGKQHYSAYGFGSKDNKKIEKDFLDQQERDLYKKNICDKFGIQLIVIDGRKLKNKKLKEYIVKFIIPILKGTNV